ncbi:DUF6541 family protein [Actinocrispum wychmicini]|uniref:Dolichyl-phosphate-mannose-protein mannosyltransferase n=1 Tax=Actinocrispum wychmicini TaxID=1213861 RepID=A0A4R2JYS2_9PSEU|nr:DUF6541 family protein [Actinocrispum wychmicini]TCO64487.1 hypothetical protein EV192_101263 [Actinocrispum wychmicini]
MALLLLAFWLPGLVFGAAVKLRGWILAAAAPALTFGIVAVGGYLLGRLGIRWDLLDFAIWTAAVSIVGFVIVFFVSRRGTANGTDSEKRRTLGQHLMVGGGVVAGMAVGVVTFLGGITSLDWVNQDWDAPYHGNLVRWIAEHGSTLPSTIGTIANQPTNTDYFYPDTYHALLALVLDKGGLDMPHLLNLGALMGILAWPLGIAAMCLAWRLPPVAAAAAACVSTWFSPFPYDSLARGPLWPYVAGIALLPAILATATLVLRNRGATGPIVAAVAAAGLAGLHTSLAFVLVVLFVLILLAGLFRFEPVDWRASAPAMIATVVIVGVVAAPLVLPSLAGASGVTSAQWPPEATQAAAFTQALTFSGVVNYPLWAIGIPAFIGIVIMARQCLLVWLVGAYALFGLLYAATVSLDLHIVDVLTGIFYNDHWRLAALLPLPGAVAFGVFVWKTGEWLGRKVTRVPAAVFGLAIVLVCAVLAAGAYIPRNTERLATRYTDGPAVSSAERAGYAWLATQVRPGEVVMNDFHDGSVWMYALAGVRPAEWTYYGAEHSDAAYLTENLNRLNTDPRVRAALDTLKIRYVIVGTGMVRDYTTSPGFVDLATTRGFQQVFHNEGATVYEIEGQRERVRS